MERRLTAIFALDMVGYARHMELDEAYTLARHESAHTELFDPAISRHKGRTVKSTGDGLLAEFPSAVDAVECAAEIQRGMAEREADVPAEHRIAYRIGIAIGDIVARDDDIYGGGVIVAARMESLASPGEILISDIAFSQVHNKVKLGFEDRGRHAVKNLKHPIHVYRVLPDPAAPSTPLKRAKRRYRNLGVTAFLAVVAAIALWQLLPRLRSPDEVPSIAVLPFANMSSDPDQEYFADGMAEELIALLASIPGLRVVSRTSAFSFKGQNLEIPEIAERLNVAHVLEGSVRREGNAVRITAQLIDARTDTHLWSEVWDRTLEDVFDVQDEIAAEVVDRLTVTLLGEAPQVTTTDPESYALFLQARELGRQATPDGSERAVELLQRALARDSAYAPSWTELSRVYTTQASYGLLPLEAGVARAREAGQRAVALDPQYAPAHSQLGWIAMVFDGDLARAARHMERALQLAPSDAEILDSAALLAGNLGRLDESRMLLELAAVHDPVSRVVRLNLGLAHRTNGRWDDAIEQYRIALDLAPSSLLAHHEIALALLGKGEPEAALAENEREPEEGWRLVGRVAAYHDLGRAADSDAALRELIERYGREWAYNIAGAYAWRGEADRAFEWLAKAAEYGDPGLSEIPTAVQWFANLRDDPRWIPFLESIGKSPEQLAAIEFEVTLPQ